MTASGSRSSSAGPRSSERLRVAARVLCLLVVALLAPRDARAQFHDPQLVWHTLESRHFRIHFHQGLAPLAQRVADIGEGVYQAVGTLMGWHPRQVVEVLLSDHTDDSNGSANAVPYNVLRLFATSPEDLSELSDYDSYAQQLMTHEFVHIAHLDNIHGLPSLINAIFGKIYPPNAAQPSWVLEGAAVYGETRFTTGGRLRAAPWNMFMRADALADHFVTLDQLSNGGGIRWPHGQSAYLYGSFFIQYIVERFGEHVLADVATDYGQQLIPGAINRSLQRSTGHTYEELYPEFLAHLRERFGAERDAVVARGLIEGTRITTQGEYVAYPRFLPDGRTVAFYSNDGQSHTQLRTVDLSDPTVAHPRVMDGDWIDTLSGFAFDAGGHRMIASDTGFHRQIYYYRELYARDIDVRRDGRMQTANSRVLTDDARAVYPDISPDDDHVAFAENHRGTQQLWEMSLTERQPHVLLRVPRYEQVYTPRYSPDGRRIAFSQWQTGGYRDIRVLDRATGRVTDITHDRALDMQPVWTPDGRYLVWSSDRTGIANLYALEVETGALRQVTNVLTGAYMPAISPDGRTLVYVGYTTWGWDLFRMPFDPSRWLEATEPRAVTGTALPTPHAQTRLRPYNPWQTFRPFYYGVDLRDDGFGSQAGIYTSGGDLVGNHAYSARLGIGLVRGDPSVDVSYVYSGMRPSVTLHAYRNVAAGHHRIGTTDVTYAEDRWGGESGVYVYFPALFMSNALSFSYETQYLRTLGELPFNRYADPNEPPSPPPFQGWTSGLRAVWSFSRVMRPTYGISAQEGYDGAITVHGTDPAFGSARGSFDVSAAADGYIAMPWGLRRRPHVLAIRAAGGLGIADEGARAIFFLGGFPSYGFSDFVSSFVNLSSSGGVALRGYAPFSRYGNSFFLCNVEYRFPIVDIGRGASTLPVYLSRLYGSVSLDVGSAFFGRMRAEDIAVGAAIEVLADVVVGWWFAYTVRLGLAQGLTGGDAILQPYVLLSAPF